MCCPDGGCCHECRDDWYWRCYSCCYTQEKLDEDDWNNRMR